MIKCENLKALRIGVEKYTQDLTNGFDITVLFDDDTCMQCRDVNSFERLIRMALNENGGNFISYYLFKVNNEQIVVYLLNNRDCIDEKGNLRVPPHINLE